MGVFGHPFANCRMVRGLISENVVTGVHKLQRPGMRRFECCTRLVGHVITSSISRCQRMSGYFEEGPFSYFIMFYALREVV